MREMTSRNRFDKGPFEEWSILTHDAGLKLLNHVVFPVRIRSVFCPGGWRRVANNQEEYRQYVEEGLEMSQVGEVLISWNVPKKRII